MNVFLGGGGLMKLWIFLGDYRKTGLFLNILGLYKVKVQN